MPEVSVVIPAYNAGSTLSQTLASVAAQSFTDYEVIVVDDGSTDDTGAIASAQPDARVRLISIENGGVAAARNRGIAEAGGTLIAFLDADDLWRPAKLARQVEQLAGDPQAGMCVTAATRIDAQSVAVGSMRLASSDDTCAALLLHSMVAGCISSGLVRRSVIEDVGGFDPAFSQCADWDLWLRLSRSSRFKLLDDELVLYRTHSTNMSSDVSLLERDTFAVLDRFFADESSAAYLALRRRAYSNHWLACSGSYLHKRMLPDSVRCLAHALREDPTNLSRPFGLPGRWRRRLVARLRHRR